MPGFFARWAALEKIITKLSPTPWWDVEGQAVAHSTCAQGRLLKVFGMVANNDSASYRRPRIDAESGLERADL